MDMLPEVFKAGDWKCLQEDERSIKKVYNVVTTSDNAKFGTHGNNKGIKDSMPFDIIKCGQSFLVPIGEVSENTIRAYAYQMSKKLNKYFKVSKNKKEGYFEVARMI